MISLRSLLSFSIPFLLSACATASGSFVPLGSNHPSSAQAPEVPITDPSAFLRAEDGENSAAEESPASADAASATLGAYVCPMHAGVSSNEPGRCPKCGMQLVPRESTEHHDGEEHPHVH